MPCLCLVRFAEQLESKDNPRLAWRAQCTLEAGTATGVGGSVKASFHLLEA